MRSTARTFASIAAALVVAAALAGPAAAQDTEVPRNVRVRLTLAGEREQRVVGVVLPDAGDSLMVRTGDSLTVIPRDRVRRVELPSRGGRRIGMGALIGAAAGAVVGTVAGVTCPEDCQPEMPADPGRRGRSVWSDRGRRGRRAVPIGEVDRRERRATGRQRRPRERRTRLGAGDLARGAVTAHRSASP